MATVTFQGNPVHTVGQLPQAGSSAPEFTLVGKDLGAISLSSFRGKKVVLNIFPSLDTPTCAASVRRFNQEASAHHEVNVLCISRDLPFAHGRFCSVEGLDQVISASEFRNSDFSDHYGVRITDSPLEGLMARSVVILDEQGKVIYTELVSEISNEPNYEAALKALD